MGGGITTSQAAANLLRAFGDEVGALREDFVAGRIELEELERRVEGALRALGHEDLDEDGE